MLSARGYQAIALTGKAQAESYLRSIGASQVLPNLMYATGHYRNGVLLAPLTAELVADAMLEDRIDPVLEATSPRRFGRL